MSRRVLVVLGVLLVCLIVVPGAAAKRPGTCPFCFWWAAETEPYFYCFWSGPWGEVTGPFKGCVIQTDTPGRAAHGTFYQFEFDFPAGDPFTTFFHDLPDPSEATGTCHYNLATFNIPGRPGEMFPPKPAMNHCTGSLEGMRFTVIARELGVCGEARVHGPPR